ncbi:hypothetical protein WA158_000791 [Blastocystis sp. Blastoise]
MVPAPTCSSSEPVSSSSCQHEDQQIRSVDPSQTPDAVNTAAAAAASNIHSDDIHVDRSCSSAGADVSDCAQGDQKSAVHDPHSVDISEDCCDRESNDVASSEKAIEVLDKKRPIVSSKGDFCLSIIMDCTGSMNPPYNEKFGKEESKIVGQFIGYRDFYEPDYIEHFSCSEIIDDFEILKEYIDKVEIEGGGFMPGCCAGMCEDVEGGIEQAYIRMNKEPYNNYKHIGIIIGDQPNHGIYEVCTLNENPETHENWDDIWDKHIEIIKNIDVEFYMIPINCINDSEIVSENSAFEFTADLLHSLLPKQFIKTYIQDDLDFAHLFAKIITDSYERYMSIS